METTIERADATRPRSVDLSAHIRAMATTAITSSIGMSDEDYAKLWPKSVRIPKHVGPKFRRVLLVDTSVSLRALQEAGSVRYLHRLVRPDTCSTTVRDPGQRHGRYILFFRPGIGGLPALEARKRYAKDEARGLTVIEGLCLAIQHPELLKEYGLNLVGSQHSDKQYPYLMQLDYATVAFGARSGMARSEIFRTPACSKVYVPVAAATAPGR